jgi:hypothetical protein
MHEASIAGVDRHMRDFPGIDAEEKQIPGASLFHLIERAAWNCPVVVRGTSIPAARWACRTSPLQSKPSGVLPPKR